VVILGSVGVIQGYGKVVYCAPSYSVFNLKLQPLSDDYIEFSKLMSFKNILCRIN